MKSVIYLLVLVVLTSCSIKINSHDNEKRDFRTNLKVIKYKDTTSHFINNQFVEIDAKDIATISFKREKSIFYLLAPWCSPCVKKFVDYYPRLDSLSKKLNVPLYVFNNSYGFEKTIEKVYKKVKLQSPIYVLDNAVYNEDIDINTSKFLHEICHDCTSNSNGWILILDKNSQVIYFINDLEDFSTINNGINEKL